MIVYNSDRMYNGYFSVMVGFINFLNQIDRNNISDFKVNIFAEKYHDLKYENSYYQYFDNIILLNYDRVLKFNNFNNFNIINSIRYNNYDTCDAFFYIELREYINYLINKYIHLNNDMKLLINNNKIPNNYLGVHIRHTDHNEHGTCKTIEEYIKCIDSQIDKFDGLYVMCDEQKNLNILKERYKNILYVNDIIRSDSSNNIHDNNRDNKFKIGQDIILETYLLSQCSKIIITSSNISVYAVCLNTKIPYYMIDLDYNFNM